MFPIGDDQVRGGPFPFVNIAIIVICTIVWFYEVLLGNNVDQFITTYGVVPSVIQSGHGWITLITSQFLHGGWLHIIGNMLFLFVFGDNIEAVMGHLGYLFFYLFTGIVAGLTQVIFSLGSDIPSIGASGAIAGVLGAYILLFPHSRIRTLVVFIFITVTRISAILFLGIWFVLQFFSGITSLGVPTAQTSGVAVWAHVGGFLSGLVIALFVKYVVRPNYSY